MAGISIKSRYAHSIIIKEGEIYYISGTEPILIKQFEDNIEHIWKQGDRLDLLAKRYYGDHRLWWIIAEFNNIMYFFDEIAEGTKLILPSITRVVMDIL